MRSEEFFNILDDMDERLVSEIYEDVQRPQKLAAVPRSPKRLTRLLLGGAACAAVIAAAAVTARLALPGRTAWLDPASANDTSGISGSSYDWFAEFHFSPLKIEGTFNEPGETPRYLPEEERSIPIPSALNWFAEDYVIRAVDDGTVVFAGKISDEYGSGVVIDHNGRAYTAYGGLDPNSVTVSVGDVIKAGEVFAKPEIFNCGGNRADTALEFKSSVYPITEDYFRESCEKGCELMRFQKKHYNEDAQGLPAPDGTHRIAAVASSEVGALDKVYDVIYAGTDGDGGGMVITRHYGHVYIVYKGLDSRLPISLNENNKPKRINDGDTIGYVGSSGSAYWFVLDLHEFKEFARENSISTKSRDIVSKHE